MFRFYFKCADFNGLCVYVDAKDRDAAFNAITAHVQRPSSWYLWHTRDLSENKPARTHA